MYLKFFRDRSGNVEAGGSGIAIGHVRTAVEVFGARLRLSDADADSRARRRPIPDTIYVFLVLYQGVLNVLSMNIV